MHHPQVVQSPIANNYLKVKIDGHTKPQLFPKLLLHVFVREYHKNLDRNTKDGWFKESRDEDNNIIISDSELRSLLPPQFKTFCQDTRLCVVVNVAYLPKLRICHCYHGVIVIFKNSWISSKNFKTEGLGEEKIVYMKLIKIQTSQMDVILAPRHITWQRQKCVHTHSQIMCYHTGNVYCDVVTNIQALIFLTRKHVISIPTPVLRFVFTFIIWLHVVQNIAGFCSSTRNVVVRVNRVLLQGNQKIYILERASDDEDNHFQFSYQVFYSRNPEVGVSHSTHTNT